MLLCVVILSGSVGTRHFDVNHMEKVEATTIVIGAGITLATIFEICLFVGTTAVTAYGIYEGYENREDIARFGKEFIDSCGDTVDGWVTQIVDASGQDYVFGSEALELVQDTEWSAIQGGIPPEGDPNKKDDKDKDKFHIPGDPMTHVAQFTTLGATWFTANARNIYQDWCGILDGWVGKDTPVLQDNVLYNNFPQVVTDADIAAQWSGKHTITEGIFPNGIVDGKHMYNNFTWNDNFDYPVAARAVRNGIYFYYYDGKSVSIRSMDAYQRWCYGTPFESNQNNHGTENYNTGWCGAIP